MALEEYAAVLTAWLGALPGEGLRAVGDRAVLAIDHQRMGDEQVFRQDLLLRLNMVEIELPPLRNRLEDIPMLLDHFPRGHERRYATGRRDLAEGVLARLSRTNGPATSPRCAMWPNAL